MTVGDGGGGEEEDEMATDEEGISETYFYFKNKLEIYPRIANSTDSVQTLCFYLFFGSNGSNGSNKKVSSLCRKHVLAQ